LPERLLTRTSINNGAAHEHQYHRNTVDAMLSNLSRMRESGLRTLLILFGGIVVLVLVLIFRPQYLANPQFLGAAIAAQILLFSVARYKQWFSSS
jgi:hypothetical protein